MPARKNNKATSFFDPNKSDSDDENFELEATRSRSRKSTKRSRPQTKKSAQKKRPKRNQDSDISDDTDVSEGEESFSDEIEVSEAEMDDNGRPKRKAKQITKSYAESDEEEKNVDTEVEEPAAKKQHVVKLKLAPEKLRAGKTPRRAGSTTARGQVMVSGSLTRRSTRARSTVEGDDLVELSTSGRHEIAVRASHTPEPQPFAARSSRASKSVKQPAAIQEATHESSSFENADDDVPMIETDIVDEEIKAAPARSIHDSYDQGDDVGDDETDAEAEADIVIGNNESESQAVANEDEDDDEDDEPVTAKGRSRGKQAVVDDDDMEDAEPVVTEDSATKRLTRKSAAGKNDREQSSDFEPDHDSADDDLSVSAKGNDDGNDESPVGHGRARRGKSQSSRRRTQVNTEEDEQSPEKEAAEELQELGRRRRPKEIQYEEGPRKVRAVRARPDVDYRVQPLTDMLQGAEEESAAEEFATPSRAARGKGGASKAWDRSWATTYGPFGGGGGRPPVVTGPWGNGTIDPDSDSSDDEGAQRRADTGGNLGMTPTTAMAPQLLPSMGQPNNAEVNSGAPANFGRVKSAKAMADIDPLGVDPSIDFSKVGGLDGHIDQLKEMVQMPLLYPELFLKYKVTPPRGVLFHGPPGTGKTLLARALAAQVGDGQQKISFYMRKGADTLSKWVGEAERQLGLLFEQARKTQPSIIFFDEIDGLAPVRSSKADQTHSSIVATLLALMDGLDGRGQVIVIGATNRPDSVDPALRRPGRFDREFYFPLPDTTGRLSILNIHTEGWGIDEAFKRSLADLTKGYGGADIRALCTEATLNAIQRTFPQIYSSNQKLLIDADKIKVNAKDFMLSVKKMVPSSERSTSSGAAPLPAVVEPLLREQFQDIKEIVENLLPISKKVTALQEAMYEQYDDADHGFGREILQQEFEKARVFRPRLLIKGQEGMGQSYLGSALLHNFEGVHVQNLDLSTMYSDSTITPEAALIQLFAEAKRHKPSVIYLPGVDTWYKTVGPSAITTFQGMLKSIATTDPVLVLGIANTEDTAKDLERLFQFSNKNIYTIRKPNKAARRTFFSKIVEYTYLAPKDFPDPIHRKKRKLEVLPLAPPPPAHIPSREDLKEQEKRDRQVLNQLKIRLQPIMDEMKKKYKKFFQPCVPRHQYEHLLAEQDPNFVRPDVSQPPRAYEISFDKEGVSVLKETATGKLFYNLELSTIEERLANGFYSRAKDFLTDIRYMVHDNSQLGDRDRKFKAHQLLANVEIDVDIIENLPILADCEGVYRRMIQRTKEKEEKARKKAASRVPLASPVHADVRSDVPVPGTQVAEGSTFNGSQALVTPFSTPAPSTSNGYGYGSFSTDAHNRLSLNSMDVEMSGTETHSSNGPSQTPVALASQWPLITRDASNISARATGITTQHSGFQQPSFSEQSHWTSNASTTTSGKKTSDAQTDHSSEWSTQAKQGGTNSSHTSSKKTSDNQTNRSSDWSIQTTYGGTDISHPPGDSQLEDTQGTNPDYDLPNTQSQGAPYSQISAAEDSWPPSQGWQQQQQYHGHNGSSNPSQVVSQPPPPVPMFPPQPLHNSNGPSIHSMLANSPPSSEVQFPLSQPPSTASSLPSSQKPIVSGDEHAVHLLDSFVDGTEGCTVEMLEQVYRELMVEIWKHRGVYQRTQVEVYLLKRFQQVLEDMEEVRGRMDD